MRWEMRDEMRWDEMRWDEMRLYWTLQWGAFRWYWKGISYTAKKHYLAGQKNSITTLSYAVDANCVLQHLRWKDLYTQHQIDKALMVYGSLNGPFPEYLSFKFPKWNVICYSLGDSADKLVVPFSWTNFPKSSFRYSGATLWNSLPCNLGKANLLEKLKHLLNLEFIKQIQGIHGEHACY